MGTRADVPPEDGPVSAARQAFAGYSDEDKPLGSYAVLTAVFGTAFAGGLTALARSGRKPPERVGAGDLALIGVATHKLTRLLAKDKVTSFARAPFTEYEEGAGQGEVSEHPRGSGMQRALGELVLCPYCLGQWVAGAFTLGLVGAPRTTRLIAGMYVAETISDGLSLAYVAGKQRV